MCVSLFIQLANHVILHVSVYSFHSYHIACFSLFILLANQFMWYCLFIWLAVHVVLGILVYLFDRLIMSHCGFPFVYLTAHACHIVGITLFFWLAKLVTLYIECFSFCKGETLYTVIHIKKDTFKINRAMIIASQVAQVSMHFWLSLQWGSSDLIKKNQILARL